MKKFEISFSKIEWGEDDAKNDGLLGLYFVEFPGYDEVLSGKKRYIIGRKGTGKSAILQKLRLDSEADSTSFFTDVSLRDFPLNDFKSLGDRSQQDKSKYVSAWKFLLLMEVAGLLVQDNSIVETTELSIIKKMIQDNFPDGISMAETIRVLRQNGNRVSVTTSILSGEHTRTSETEVTAQVHYNKVVKSLETIIQRIHTHSQFFLLIDELDEGYQAKNSNTRLVILSLLRAADEIYKLFKVNSIKCIPVLALRSDIFDSLEDNDLNKLDDYVLRLNWTTDERSQWSLKQIAEKRIEATIKAEYPEFAATDYWSLVSENDSVPKGLWQYLCVLTFSRPRDIVKLLKYCAKAVRGNKLTMADVQSVEVEYSGWFYREFRDEAQSFLSCWKGALNCISEVAKGKERIDVLVKRFEVNSEVQKWCEENGKSPLDVVRILFDYSVIGCINEEGRWIFKYKDDYFEFMSSYPYYCVHFGFCRKLRIPKSYDRTIIEVYHRYN